MCKASAFHVNVFQTMDSSQSTVFLECKLRVLLLWVSKRLASSEVQASRGHSNTLACYYQSAGRLSAIHLSMV